MISIIAAQDKKGTIGNGEKLPWPRLPADFAQFREKTLGKTVIMGRKTYASLGRPLPKRTNVIITRDAGFAVEGAIVVHSIEEALTKAGEGEVMVLGGAEIYRAFLPLADKMHLTFVDGEFPGDVRFPEFNQEELMEVSRTKHPADGQNQYGMEFVTYERKTV
jgi:dihydrofolate reductase